MTPHDSPASLFSQPSSLEDLQQRVQELEQTVAAYQRREQEQSIVCQAISSSPEAIAIVDLSGQLLYHNDTWQQLYGYHQSHLNAQGGLYSRFTVPELAQDICASLQRGQSWNGEIQFKDPEGHLLTTWLKATPIWDEAKNCIGFFGIYIHLLAQSRPVAETNYARFFNLNADLLSVIGLDGYFKHINSAATKILGWSLNEFLEQPYLEFVHPDDRAATQQEAERLAKGQATSYFENRYRTADGRYKWLAWTATPFVEDGIMYAMARDITPQKQMEAALQASEAKFRSLIESVSGVVYSLTPTGKFSYVSPKWTDLLGHPVSEIEGKHFREFLHPEDITAWEACFQQLLTDGGSISGIEYRIRHQDGTWRWHTSSAALEMNPTGQGAYVVGFGSDITGAKRLEEARKALEQELAFRQARFDAFFRAAPAGLEIIDDQLRIVHINETLAEMDGIPVADHLGKRLGELLPELAVTLEPILRRILSTGQSVLNVEVSGETPKQPGLIRHWVASYFPLPGQDQTIVGVGSVVVEITERKQAEAALKSSEERYRALAQQEELVNRLAQQIRNSLDLDTILETVVMELYQRLPIDFCTFSWYDLGQAADHSQGLNYPHWNVIQEAKHPQVPSFIGCYPAAENRPFTEKMLRLNLFQVDDYQQLRDVETKESMQRLSLQSVIALPIQTQSGQIGCLCCGRLRSAQTWTAGEVELLQAVADNLAIAVNQAELYTQARLEKHLATEKANQLERAMQELQQAQTQLIQTEKMSSLGQLVAGVAHEINNPTSFIYGNVSHANEYIEDLLDLLALYQHHYPNPTPEIQEKAEEIDLEFVVEDLPKLLTSMKMGANRIREIVLSLRNFSRLDEAAMKPVDIHEGIDNTLLILANRLKAKNGYVIHVEKEYETLPKVECYVGQLNQVFMNLLTNAIDALEDYHQQRDLAEVSKNPSKITIKTEFIAGQNPLFPDKVAIHIQDNGPGIPPQVKDRLFDPFFTTKPVGKGTGLGLSISYQIVVEKHGGQLVCHSELGKGSEFVIEIPVHQPEIPT